MTVREGQERGLGMICSPTAAHPALEEMMNEDVFNMGIRKFLKKVGVASQREIENGVREALKAGRLAGDEKLKAHVTLEVAGISLKLVIEDEIALA
jgi:hypothetical protein